MLGPGGYESEEAAAFLDSEFDSLFAVESDLDDELSLSEEDLPFPVEEVDEPRLPPFLP